MGIIYDCPYMKYLVANGAAGHSLGHSLLRIPYKISVAFDMMVFANSICNHCYPLVIIEFYWGHRYWVEHKLGYLELG